MYLHNYTGTFFDGCWAKVIVGERSMDTVYSKESRGIAALAREQWFKKPVSYGEI